MTQVGIIFLISHQVLFAVFGGNLLTSLHQLQSRGKKRVLFKVKGIWI